MITASKTTNDSVDYASLMDSGKTVEQLIERDSKYPDLSELLRGKDNQTRPISQRSNSFDLNLGPTSDQYAKRVSTGEQDFIKDTTRVIPPEISDLIDGKDRLRSVPFFKKTI